MHLMNRGGAAGSMSNLSILLLIAEEVTAPVLLAGAARSALTRTSQARILLLMLKASRALGGRLLTRTTIHCLQPPRPGGEAEADEGCPCVDLISTQVSIPCNLTSLAHTQSHTHTHLHMHAHVLARTHRQASDQMPNPPAHP